MVFGGITESIRFIVIGMAIGIVICGMCKCSSSYEGDGECCCCYADKPIPAKAKKVVSKDPPWCEKAINRGYLTAKEFKDLRMLGHTRWVEVKWSAPPGVTWERVVVPTAESRLKYIRNDYRISYGDDRPTIDVVMFESEGTLISTRQLVVKATLGSYSPAIIYEVDIDKAYRKVGDGYLKEIGEQI